MIAPIIALIARMSRQLVRYLENIRTVTPVNIKPGCQERHASIEKRPAQNGWSLASSSSDSIPNTISASFGSVPATIQSAKRGSINGSKKAMTAALRLRKYVSVTRKMSADNEPTRKMFSNRTAIKSLMPSALPTSIANALR